MAKTGAHDTARSGFIDRMGSITHGEGMPRVSGEIFAMLVYDGEPIAFGEIAKSLGVSRATVSTSIRLLEDRGMVRRSKKPGNRQDYFQLADDAYLTMMKFVLLGMSRAQSVIDETISAVPQDDEDRRRRLEDYAGFYAQLGESMTEALSRMSKTKP